MKKTLSLLAMVFAIGLSSVAMDAEARRIGGGKSFGMQRQSAPPAKAPTATPAQTPANAAAPAAAGAPAAAAASTRSKWMGPIAGLAAGLGLAALASHLGFGEGLANMLMIGLLVVAAFAAFRFFMAKRAASQGGGAAYAGAGAGAGNAGNNAFRMPSTPASHGGTGFSQGGSMIGANLQQPASTIPADFDVPAFVRNAKVNFIRLQAANDAGNLDDIRAFTTPEMFAEIQMDIRERNGATQETRVLDLEASVLEVAEEDAIYVVSTHFTGRVQEDGADPEDINEVWHLTKPRQGNGGWVLAGIQQIT
ncbi:MAG: 39S ribosomal protein L45 [Hydrogenophaga sp.]|nr:39S ribosomal protein L45 [Hydrogenophaga sp.]